MTTTRRDVMTGGVLLGSVGFAALADARQTLPPPKWAQPMPLGPVPGTKITEEYAELVGRHAYFWAWPLANIYIRRQVHEKVSEVRVSGAMPVAPLLAYARRL